MVTAICILLLAVSITACAVMIAWLSREHRKLSDEVVELQAMVDTLLLAGGHGAYFAERHGLEFVLDPSKLPPPDVPREPTTPDPFIPERKDRP